MTTSITELKRRAALLRRGILENLSESSQANRRAMMQNRELAEINEQIEAARQRVRADG